MSPPESHNIDDARLTQYLLGVLPAEEAERMDELSVTDDEFSWRLREVENNLVDAYVHSELSGETLKQFKACYLSSEKRRQKIAFAEGLLQFRSNAAMAKQRAGRAAASESFFSRLFSFPRMGAPFAVAACLMLLIFSYLIFDDVRLRYEMNGVNSLQSSIEQRAQEMERDLRAQRAANAEAQRKLDLAANQATNVVQYKTISLLLPPPTRGISSIKTI